MEDFAQRKCKPCEGGVPPYTPQQAAPMLGQLKCWIIEAGKLVKVDKLDESLRVLLTNLARFLDSIPGQLGRELDLSEETVRRLRHKMDDARPAFTRDMQREFADAEVDTSGASPAAGPAEACGSPAAAAPPHIVNHETLDASVTDFEEEPAPGPDRKRAAED